MTDKRTTRKAAQAEPKAETKPKPEKEPFVTRLIRHRRPTPLTRGT